MLVGFQLRYQHQVGLDPLVAALDDEVDLVAGIVAADFLLDLAGAGDLAAADLDDAVAALEAGLGGGRIGAAGGDDRVAGQQVFRLQEDAGHAGVKVLALFQLGQHGLERFQRDGEADAGVVPLDAGDFLRPTAARAAR